MFVKVLPTYWFDYTSKVRIAHAFNAFMFLSPPIFTSDAILIDKKKSIKKAINVKVYCWSGLT